MVVDDTGLNGQEPYGFNAWSRPSSACAPIWIGMAAPESDTRCDGRRPARDRIDPVNTDIVTDTDASQIVAAVLSLFGRRRWGKMHSMACTTARGSPLRYLDASSVSWRAWRRSVCK